MITGLIAHLWLSTIFCGVAWMTTLVLKKNPAQLRYRLWFIASVKFLVPFSALAGLGALMLHQVAVATKPVAWVSTAEQIGRPLLVSPVTAVRVAIANEQTTRDSLALTMLILWACGFLAIATVWLFRWERVHARLKLAKPVAIAGASGLGVPVLYAPGPVEPGIFGVFRPVLLLPDGIAERLDYDQLDAILAHELCHVRRRDNLTSAIHMVVQAIFWFHPLVWWLGSRLVEERERACDEEVLRLGRQPKIYAAAILSVCKLYVESPLVCMAGVTGSNLTRRVQQIMRNRVVLRLSFGRKAVLVGAAMAAVMLPVVICVMDVPGVRAATPKFEVASIRLGCAGGARTGAQGKQAKISFGVSSPGRLMECGPLEMLIRMAYVWYADGQFHGRTPGPAIEGGPEWMHSDSYQISAKPEGTPKREMMSGPMLQGLLEDRFRLKVRRESREVPVYALTVGKSGGKLTPFQEGSCVRLPQLQPGQIMPEIEPGKMPCMNVVGLRNGPNMGLKAQGDTMEEFARLLGLALNRPVIDKTGITGRFDIHLEFANDQSTPKFLPGADPEMAPAPQSDDPAGASIFTAVQTQLGLKLEATRGPSEFLVVEHVERPSAN